MLSLRCFLADLDADIPVVKADDAPKIEVDYDDYDDDGGGDDNGAAE